MYELSHTHVLNTSVINIVFCF